MIFRKVASQTPEAISGIQFKFLVSFVPEYNPGCNHPKKKWVSDLDETLKQKKDKFLRDFYAALEEAQGPKDWQQIFCKF